MVAATGKPAYQEPFRPLPDGFVNVPFNDIEAIRAATTETTAAVMLEPVQGEGGVNEPDASYWKQVREWCDQKGMLLIADEVQTGVGRLGSLWGHTLFGVEPDIMTLAKGLGSGVPIGALLAKEHASAFEPGDHGSTYGGNPLMCAVGIAVMRYVLENDLPAQAERRGNYFKQRVEELRGRWPTITGVRGRGLLLAVQFDRDISNEVLLAGVKEGVLVNAVTPSAIRVMPALTITEAELDEAVARLERAMSRVASQASPIPAV
jgi:acetylornithine/succinyldiaminopimelate/putrescine aminotransferase